MGEPALCMDCAVDTSEISEWYMVQHSVWYACVSTSRSLLGDAFLCIGCLEKRLGRQLTPEDFTDALVNAMYDRNSQRLNDRLGYAVRESSSHSNPDDAQPVSEGQALC